MKALPPMKKILITGAGGPAAVGLVRSAVAAGYDVFAADMSPAAAGLYLVPPDRRFLVPPGKDEAFTGTVFELCRTNAIDLLIPTVDVELRNCARAEGLLKSVGTQLLCAGDRALRGCLDKYELLSACAGDVPVGRFELIDESFDPHRCNYPVIVKPRSGSGSRGIFVAHSADDLAGVTRNGEMMVQDYLPGAEYSVDVLADRDGNVRASVVRERMVQDSGVAVVARTLRDQTLERFAARVVRRMGLRYVCNVQFRRTSTGTPVLMEVNPRFPGSMAITVASGVDMPVLAIEHALGEPLPRRRFNIMPVEMVRFLEERFLEAGTLARTETQSKAKPLTSEPLALAG